MPIFIYGLVCPVAGVVRYVGKSVRPQTRLRAHIHAASRGAYNHRTARWLRKVLSAGLEPSLILLHEVQPHERWQDVERALIASAPERGWSLTNSTAGGEGLDYVDPDAERRYRDNLSRAMKEVWGTPERRLEAQRRAQTFYADTEAAARKAEAVRAAYRDPALLERARKINAEINARPEVRAKRSASCKAAFADPETRARQKAGFTPEVRAQMSASAKARWADPEKGAAARAGHSSPERRAALSESARRRATPEYRAMMAEKTRASWLKRRPEPKEA